MTEPALLRKQPTSKRGRQRVDKILDAAAELIVEVGYAGVTTNAIAERAETSIGSLYQFFKNKDVLLEALADRYITRLHEKLNTYFNFTPGAPLPDIVDELIQGTRQYYLDNPGFEPLFFGSVNTPALEEIGYKTYMDMIARVDVVLAQHGPARPIDERRTHAHVIVSIMKLQLPHLRTIENPEQREAFYKQVRAMVRAYVTEFAS